MRVIVKEKKETGISLAEFSVALGSTGCSGSASPGGMPPPPGKFVKLDSLKCNFLRSLDRNWVTGKVFKALYKKCSRKNIHVYCFKRRATAVLSWLDCSSTTASTSWFQTSNLIQSNRTAVAKNKTQHKKRFGKVLNVF